MATKNYSITIEAVGQTGCPRFLIRDSYARYFSGDEWTCDRSLGLLFDDLAKAIEQRDYLRKSVQPRLFEAVVRVRVDHDCKLEGEELQDHLESHTMFYIAHSSQRCEAQVDWNTLRQVND